MDCNSYSYVNMGYNANEIARYDGDKSIIIMEREQNYFGDLFYYVFDLLGDAAETFDIDASEGWNTERSAYEQAARFYNSLVPDKATIPLF